MSLRFFISQFPLDYLEKEFGFKSTSKQPLEIAKHRKDQRAVTIKRTPTNQNIPTIKRRKSI
jgi:hypothetical protein